MRIEQQQAWILHGRPYRETSLLLECFTREHGRIGLVARGVRKERSRVPRALLQPLTPVSVGWSGGGELATLTAVDARAEPVTLIGEGLLCGLYLNELVLRMTMRMDPQAELFDCYERTLGRLASGESHAWTLRRFERDLLVHLGYGLALATEAQAEAPLAADMDYAYRHEHGPSVWRTAADGPRLKGSTLLDLAADRKPPDNELPALRRWMRAAIAAHLDGGELRAWNLLGVAAPRPRA
ncbi:MAG TPA: DNA repair protein RecO [Rudaea sp.]|nr:DNA repair protein RecO [Rudaea sp.]